MTTQQEYIKKGYSEAEVEIIKLLTKLETNQTRILDTYVSKDEFDPIQKLVYGLVAVIVTGVIASLLALVVQ